MKRRATSLVVCLSLVLLFSGRKAHAQADNARYAEALRYLDDDAGIVLSLRPKQLQAMQKAWVHHMPHQKGASDLASLASIAILGFHPLQSSAWQAIGVDSDAQILVQLTAINRQAAMRADRGGASTLWRSRIVLPSREPKRTVEALSHVRIRDRVRFDDPDSQVLGKLLVLNGGNAERVTRKLSKAGVFMMGRPAPMDGLIIASVRDSFIVIDWLVPYGPGKQSLRWKKHEAMIMAAITRKPNTMQTKPHLMALASEAIGVWIDPVSLGSALSAAEVDGLSRKSVLRRHRRCEPFRSLARKSPFSVLSGSMRIKETTIDIHARWFINKDNALLPTLRTEERPMLSSQEPLLSAQLRLAELGALRARDRSGLVSSWDLLWNKAKACGRGSKAFALAVAWPDIAGLFLSELSEIDPSAQQVISDLGPISVSVLGAIDGDESPQGHANETQDEDTKALRINAEAWVRSPGNAIAKGWLAILFGSEKRRRSNTSYGLGPMQPYAIDQSSGSIIGTGLRTGSRAWALSAKRMLMPVQPQTLFTFGAQPASLTGLLPELPWLDAGQHFTRADGTLRVEPGAVHLQLHLAETTP